MGALPRHRHGLSRRADLAYQIMFACLCGFAITGAFHGTGQHAAEIKPQSEIPIALKVTILNIHLQTT
jgi:hypothetical protein